MIDFKTMTDTELSTIIQDVYREYDRRQRVRALPAQITELATQALVAGVDEREIAGAVARAADDHKKSMTDAVETGDDAIVNDDDEFIVDGVNVDDVGH